MIPDEDLTWAKLGCRGVLRLCARAAYYQFCERASLPFLWVYERGYRLFFVLVLRRVSPQRAHNNVHHVMAFLDRCPRWMLTFIHDVAWGNYYRQGRLARDAADEKCKPPQQAGG